MSGQDGVDAVEEEVRPDARLQGLDAALCATRGESAGRAGSK